MHREYPCCEFIRVRPQIITKGMEETNPNNSHHFGNANIKRNSFPAPFGLLRTDLRMATAVFVLEFVGLAVTRSRLCSCLKRGDRRRDFRTLHQ